MNDKSPHILVAKAYIEQLQTEHAALSARVAELVDALEDMVRQHCYTKDPDEVQSNALSANAEAIEILSRHGRIEILKGAGRMLIGRWVDNAAMRGTK